MTASDQVTDHATDRRAQPGSRQPVPVPGDQDQPPGAVPESDARWLVHVGLLVTFAAALASLVLLRHATTIHILLGLGFVALVGVHLAQRRRTVRALSRQLVRLGGSLAPRGRRAWSDVVLALLTLNVLASGTVDWVEGQNTPLPVASVTGLHVHFIGWHGASSLLLLCFLVVHVLRRRKRLRHSHIR